MSSFEQRAHIDEIVVKGRWIDIYRIKFNQRLTKAEVDTRFQEEGFRRLASDEADEWGEKYGDENRNYILAMLHESRAVGENKTSELSVYGDDHECHLALQIFDQFEPWMWFVTTKSY